MTPTDAGEGAADLSGDFRALFDSHFHYVCRTLRRFGAASSDVEDLAQEVFVTVYQKRESYDRSRPVRPWLCAFAFRVASNYLRSARHRRELAPDDDRPSPPAPEPSPEEQISERRAQSLVMGALQSVPLERRTVLVMIDIDGFTAPEVAEALEIPLNTVYSRTRLARDDFRRAVHRLRARRGEATGGGAP